MPAGLIDEQQSVGVGSDVLGDFSKMQVHREAVAGGQDEARALAFLGANGAEDIG
jgi:hypothetical protein